MRRPINLNGALGFAVDRWRPNLPFQAEGECLMPAARNPAKPNSRVRRGSLGAKNPIVELPAGGCDLPIPRLPTGPDWSRGQRARWRELWKSPQATQWDDTAIGTVACLLIFEAAVWAGTASAWQAQEARYASEALGLTPKAMTSLGWRIVE